MRLPAAARSANLPLVPDRGAGTRAPPGDRLAFRPILFRRDPARLSPKSGPGNVQPRPLALVLNRRRHTMRGRISNGAPMKSAILYQELNAFEACSYLTQQIVIDKSSHWKYKLTAALPRSHLDPVLSRWKDLEGGRYTKVLTIVPLNEVALWLEARGKEAGNLVAALHGLVNAELQASWGPPGKSGTRMRPRNPRVGRTRHFALLPAEFDVVHRLLRGVAGRALIQLARIPKEMVALFEDDHPTGHHLITLVIDLPEGWAEQICAALSRAQREITHSR